MGVKTAIVNALEEIFRASYGWIADNDEMLGRIVTAVHAASVFIVCVMVVISHVVYPVLWFQIVVFCIVALMWIQHIVLRACVCSSLERRLMGENAKPPVDPLLTLLNIPITKETRIGVTVLASTLATSLLGLELFARGVMYLRDRLQFSPWG